MNSDRLRLPLLLAAFALLPACNTVFSEHPMLNGAPPATQVPRPGLWVSTDSDCQVAIAGPARDWPNCARFVILDSTGAILLDEKDRREGDKDLSLSIRFGARDPALAEIRIDDPADPAANGYAYIAFAPDGDGQGRELTKLRFWWVKCGPSQGEKYPGIDEKCRPASLAAILGAARGSSNDDVETMRWVRQPEPGDLPTGTKTSR